MHPQPFIYKTVHKITLRDLNKLGEEGWKPLDVRTEQVPFSRMVFYSGTLERRQPGLTEATKVELSESTKVEVLGQLQKLLRFTPEGGWTPAMVEIICSDGEYQEETTARLPFFSEAVLYPLLGKDNARTLRAYLGELARICGTTRLALETEEK